MYELISRLIEHNWTTGTNEQQYVYYICGSLIVVLTAVFVDMVYRVFSHFWHK